MQSRLSILESFTYSGASKGRKHNTSTEIKKDEKRGAFQKEQSGGCSSDAFDVQGENHGQSRHCMDAAESSRATAFVSSSANDKVR